MNAQPDGWCGGPDQGEGGGVVLFVTGCDNSDVFGVCQGALDLGAAPAGIALQRSGYAVAGGGTEDGPGADPGTSVAQAVAVMGDRSRPFGVSSVRAEVDGGAVHRRLRAFAGH